VTFTVGLTGGIASGKTYVGALFERLGVPLLDADQVSRIVVTPPSPVLDRIAARFGREFLLPDGNLDRARMRTHVFADPAERRDLEAITHPAIRDYIAAWRAQPRQGYCILSNAILFESGMDRAVDRVLVVDASPETQLRRLLLRDGSDETTARQILAAQTSPAVRRARAHDVIDNDDERRALDHAVRRLHALYGRLAARP
jgi:dephospho-CoA kinase